MGSGEIKVCNPEILSYNPTNYQHNTLHKYGSLFSLFVCMSLLKPIGLLLLFEPSMGLALCTQIVIAFSCIIRNGKVQTESLNRSVTLSLEWHALLFFPTASVSVIPPIVKKYIYIGPPMCFNVTKQFKINAKKSQNNSQYVKSL